VEQGYAMLDFFEDRIQSFLWTYKVGQARCAFLEETYGSGIIQKLLEASPALAAGGSFFRRGSIDFKQLLESLTQDSPQRMSEKFQTWMKRRAFPEYLKASQDAPTVFPLHPFDEAADAMSSSPDGAVLLYRSTDMDTGHTALTLAHWRAPDQGETIAVDNAPGSESLHAGFGRNFEVKQSHLVWVAQANGRDVLRVAPYRSGAKRRGEDDLRPKPELPVTLAQRASEERWDSELWVGSTSHYDIRAKGIWAAFSPSLSPDEKRLAFIGMDDKGVRDVYVLNLEAGPKRLELSRITHDEHPEREVSWGPSGLYFTSSATGHGKFNIFKVADEASGEVGRVTSEAEDEFDLAALPDGRLLFSRYQSGRANLYQVAPDGIVRQTDVATGFFNVGPGPDGALWALFHKSGRRAPVRIPHSALEDRERLPKKEATPSAPASKLALPEGEPYRSLALRNWELGGIFGFLGGSSLGIFGRVFAVANDRLRNNSLLFDISILGDFERTNGTLLFINQEHRTTWGFGIFQSFRFRLDRTIPNLGEPFESYERYYGLLGLARHPFNRFVHVQAELSLGRIHYFTSPAGRLYLALPEENGAGDFLEEWERTHRPRLQTEATVQLGYDTLRRHPLVGPIAGSSLLLETSAIYHPQQGALFANLRADGEHHFHIDGRSQFLVRAGAGNSLGGRFARQFFLSSFDTLRAVPFGNFDWLLGDSYFYSTAELRVPLTAILRFVLFSDIEAVAGLDFGGVSDSLSRILQRRVLDYVFGANFYLGPLIFRLHFAHPIDIGLKDGEGRPLYPSGHSGWVTNFSLGIAGVPGFFMPRGEVHAHPKGSLMPPGGGGAGQSAHLSSPAW
jgi:hypothetical protein